MEMGNIQITDEDRAVYNTKPLTQRSAAPLGMADIVLREFLQSFFKFCRQFWQVNHTF